MLLLAAAAVVLAIPSRVAADLDRTSPSRVVARIGPTETVSVSALEGRIQSLSPAQLASFGDTDDAVRRRVLREVEVRDALLILAARAHRVDANPAVVFAIDRAISSAMVRALRAEIGPPSAVSSEEVAQYYQAHIDRFDAPQRLQIWRILCPSLEDARTVLGSALQAPTTAIFAQLARDHSLDKATRLRSGNLGFLTADGRSSEPGLRVAPAVVAAAAAVRDGELAPSPVREDEYWAVVWRRGSIPAVRRSVEDAAPAIRDAVWAESLKAHTDALLASLRSKNLRDANAGLLDTVALPESEPR
ncbi:MAG: peptidyl-prolyl cis-trans isomerase [Polyangiaceae bacterium]